MKPTTKKAIITFVIFLLAAGIIGALAAIANQYLHWNIYVLMAILATCYYCLYKWLAKRLDEISKDTKSE